MINSGIYLVSLLLSSGSFSVISAPINSATSELTYQDQILKSPTSELLITNLATSKALKDSGSGLSSEVYSIDSAAVGNFTFTPKWTTDSPARLLLKSHSNQYITVDPKEGVKAPANLTRDESNSWSYSLDGMNVTFRDSRGYYLCASDDDTAAIIGNKKFSKLCNFSVRLLNPARRLKIGSSSSNGPKGVI